MIEVRLLEAAVRQMIEIILLEPAGRQGTKSRHPETEVFGRIVAMSPAMAAGMKAAVAGMGMMIGTATTIATNVDMTVVHRSMIASLCTAAVAKAMVVRVVSKSIATASIHMIPQVRVAAIVTTHQATVGMASKITAIGHDRGAENRVLAGEHR